MSEEIQKLETGFPGIAIWEKQIGGRYRSAQAGRSLSAIGHIVRPWVTEEKIMRSSITVKSKGGAGRFMSFARSIFLGVALLCAGAALAEPIPKGWEAQNLRPIGFSGLEGRYGAFKLAIKKAGNGHWYLYMGHTFDSGWSILDVTDPKKPRYVKFIPGPEGWITSQLTLHDNLMITSLDIRTAQKEPKPVVYLWDISDPENPKKVSEWVGGVRGSHRNVYPGGRYAYLATSMPGYTGNIMIALDVSDPTNPKEAGRWWVPGQKDGEAKTTEYPPGFHGPVHVSPDGKWATMPYTPYILNLDISDIANPKRLGAVQMTPPFARVGVQSVHTVMPLWDRKLLFASSEARDPDCKDEGMHFAVLVDNKDPKNPQLLSFFPEPRPSKNAKYKDFCAKGGRFGVHNVNQEFHLPEVEKPGDLIYAAYFNAGLRIFNIANPRTPTEVAYFLPPEREGLPDHGGAHGSPINWTEEVLVDTRGNIYICDDKWGVFILRYTGKGQPKPTAR